MGAGGRWGNTLGLVALTSSAERARAELGRRHARMCMYTHTRSHRHRCTRAHSQEHMHTHHTLTHPHMHTCTALTYLNSHSHAHTHVHTLSHILTHVPTRRPSSCSSSPCLASFGQLRHNHVLAEFSFPSKNFSPGLTTPGK